MNIIFVDTLKFQAKRLTKTADADKIIVYNIKWQVYGNEKEKASRNWGKDSLIGRWRTDLYADIFSERKVGYAVLQRTCGVMVYASVFKGH